MLTPVLKAWLDGRHPVWDLNTIIEWRWPGTGAQSYRQSNLSCNTVSQLLTPLESPSGSGVLRNRSFVQAVSLPCGRDDPQKAALCA